MKIALVCLTFILSLQVFGADSCGPTQNYSEKIVLGNGSILFRYPGIYTGTKAYYMTVGTSATGQDVCRDHLGMTSVVSLHQERCTSGCDAVELNKGQYELQGASQWLIVSEIICK